jgi:hypothetical protein
LRLTRDLLRRTVESAGIVVLLAGGVAFCISRGPLTLRRPATVVSNAHPVMRADEPFLLYLRALRTRLPGGATVVVLSPHTANDLPAGPSYLLALGQLPEHRVVPWTVLRDPSVTPPRFVAVFRRGFHDDRYRLVSSTAEDQLWELAAPANVKAP